MFEPYIIAEIGVNYYDISTNLGISPMDAAKLMIRKAHDAGASAVKFQSYKADKIASVDSPSYWDLSKESTTNQYELFKKYDKFGEDEYIELANYCKSIGVDFMSTPFDLEAVDYLDPLVEMFKISSSDITNYQLLRKVAQKDKKVLLSTGASSMCEIRSAVEVLESAGATDIVLMHCVLNYPTTNSNANVAMINDLKSFNFPVGYSDHTIPNENMDALTIAYILGAEYIEKHFTLDKTIEGNDHYHSMDVDDLNNFSTRIQTIKCLLGTDKKESLPSELSSRKNARRSIVARNHIKAGQIISDSDLVCKRPAIGGIPANNIDDVIGTVAKVDIKKDDILQPYMI